MTPRVWCGGSRAASALERRSTSIARSGARAARAMDARGASAHVVGLLLLCLLGPRAADGGRTRLVAAGDHDGDVARAGRRGTARAHGRTCDRPRPWPARHDVRQHPPRSEERRVGKKWVLTFCTWGAP